MSADKTRTANPEVSPPPAMSRRKRQPPASAFPIVGIGASAGGLEAFQQLLGHLPDDTGMAFVLVSHLDPQHESLLAEILSRSSSMPVRQATARVRVSDVALELVQKIHLGGKILAAVRHVDRAEDKIVDFRRDDPALVVEGGVNEPRLILEGFAADVQPDSGIGALAVPVAAVALELADGRRDLRLRGFNLLEADDIGLLALDPFAELRFARANAVHIPGGDF